jgi:hypothetical protein
MLATTTFAVGGLGQQVYVVGFMEHTSASPDPQYSPCSVKNGETLKAKKYL